MTQPTPTEPFPAPWPGGPRLSGAVASLGWCRNCLASMPCPCMTQTLTGERLQIGKADYARLADYTSPLRYRVEHCRYCHTPRSEYEGHWCLTPGASREVWRQWEENAR